MTRIKKWTFSHIFFLSFFFGTLLYVFIVVWKCQPWQVTDTGYSVHALDYSLGFATSILPGAIYNFLFSELSYPKLTLYLSVVYVLFLLIVSLLLEKVMLHLEARHRPCCFLLLFFFLTGPVTISAYFSSIGFLEFYWIFFGVFFFVFLENKYLRPLIVPLCAIELLINVASILCIIPFFIILMIYKYTFISDKNERIMLKLVIILSILVSLMAFTYLVLHGPMNMVYSKEEFYQFMQSKGANDYDYRGSILYRKNDTSDEVRNFMTEHYPLYNPAAENTFSIQAFINFIIIYYCTSIGPLGDHHFASVITAFLVILPILILIIGYLRRNIKDRDNTGTKRFAYFCMAALFFFTVLTSLFSATGRVRWLSFSFLPLFSSFLYIIYLEKEKPLDYLKSRVKAAPLGILIIYGLTYSFIVPGIFAK